VARGAKVDSLALHDQRGGPEGDGTIAYKVVGPMTAETLESEVKPQILKAMAPPRS
jgi:hypothetical protein